MGRLNAFAVFIFVMGAYNNAIASDDIGQADRDVMREFYIQNILNVKPTMVNLSSDLRLMRYALRQEHDDDNREYPPIHEVPLVRIFSQKELTLGNLVKLAGLSSNFEVIIHPAVNQDERIKINQKFNSLEDIALYLDHASKASVGVANESRTLLVLPGSMRYRHNGNIGL
jgi:hypothetical protein